MEPTDLPPTVLVLDPYEQEKSDVVRTLGAVECTIVEARDQDEAFIQLRNHPNAAVVVAEETLPGPASDLVVRLREATLGPIIVLGDQRGLTELEALFLGADHYFHRPIRPALLVSRLHALLSRSFRGPQDELTVGGG